MGTAVQYAEWLETHQDEEGSPLYNEALEGYEIARKQELSNEAPVEADAEPPQAQTVGEQLYQEEPTGDLYSQPELALNRRGVRKGVMDPVEGVGEMVMGPEYTEGIRQKEAEYQAARAEAGREGFDPNRLLGNTLAMGVPGAKVAEGIKATSLAGRSAVGGLTGAGYGALTPTYAKDEAIFQRKLENIKSHAKWGAGTAAAAKPVEAVAKAAWGFAKKLIDPWTKSGNQREAVGVIDSILEQSGQKGKVVAAASQAKLGETVGQTAVRTQKRGSEVGSEIVKLETELGKLRTGRPIRDQLSKQELEREKLIDAIQEGKSLRSLERARSTPATREYKKAFKDKIKTTEEVTITVPPKPTNILDSSGNPVMGAEKQEIVTRITKKLQAILDDPFVKKAGPAANNLAKSHKITMDSNPVQYLHYLKGGLDKQLRLKSASGQDALTNQEKTAVKKVKGRLVDYLKKHSKKYEKARVNFAERSIPVDEAKLRDEMKKVLTSPSVRERPAAFLKAWKEPEKTLKRAKIGVKKEFKHVLDPVDEKGVKRVYTELVDKQEYKRLAEFESILEEIPSEIAVKLPNALWRPVMLANRALSNLVKHTKPKVQKELITMLTNPGLFVEHMAASAKDTARKEMATRLLQEVIILSTKEKEVKEQAAGTGLSAAQSVADAISDQLDRGFQ